MFDMGFSEMALIALIALIVLGPERLPEAARTLGGWVARARRFVRNMTDELERNADMQDFRDLRDEFKSAKQSAEDGWRDTVSRAKDERTGDTFDGDSEAAGSGTADDAATAGQHGDAEPPSGDSAGAAAKAADSGSDKAGRPASKRKKTSRAKAGTAQSRKRKKSAQGTEVDPELVNPVAGTNAGTSVPAGQPEPAATGAGKARRKQPAGGKRTRTGKSDSTGKGAGNAGKASPRGPKRRASKSSQSTKGAAGEASPGGSKQRAKKTTQSSKSGARRSSGKTGGAQDKVASKRE